MGLFGIAGGVAGGVFGGPIGAGIGAVAGSALDSALTPKSGFSVPRQSNDQRISSARLRKQGNMLGEFGTTQLGLFQNGQLRTGQQAEVDAAKGTASAEAEQFLAGTGLSDSSFAVGQRQQIEQQSAIMKEQLLQGNFQDALAALQLSAADYSSILSNGQFQQNLAAQMQMARQQAASSGMGSLLGAAGQIAGGYFAGGGGFGGGGGADTSGGGLAGMSFGGNGMNSTGVGNYPGV